MALTFVMGSNEYSSEKPQHKVTIEPFYMSKYPVTQAQWKAVMGGNPSRFKGDNRPVDQVSWDDAVAFCKRLYEMTGRSYRLPSEAEWEYGCRAGTETPFYFGETISTDLVNYNSKYEGTPTDGRVWEKEKGFLAKLFGGGEDPKSEPRLLRGGSWYNDGHVCRSANRDGSPSDLRNAVAGSRVALVRAAWT